MLVSNSPRWSCKLLDALPPGSRIPYGGSCLLYPFANILNLAGNFALLSKHFRSVSVHGKPWSRWEAWWWHAAVPSVGHNRPIRWCLRNS